MRTIIKTPYWIWPAELNDDLCKAIITEGNKLTEKSASVSGNNLVNKSIRQGIVSWFPEESWVADIIGGYVSKANKLAGWNFDINSRDKVQFGKYTKGSFYIWHRDTVNTPKYRKLSVTVQLTDSDDYTGGDFEIRDFWDKKKITIKEDIRQKGTLIVFPSILKHQVTEVTEGERHSLVQWHNGPDFV
jgi:PKHD-type hydroxylase